jgi:chromosome segregation ATPase
MLRMRFFIGILMCAAVLTACDESTAILDKIKQAESQQALSQQRMEGLKQKLSSLQNQSNDLAKRLRTRNSEIADYMSNHKVAIACMVAAGYKLRGSNMFSEEVENIISLGTVGCFLGLLSDDFRQEVVDVIAELERADTDIKNLQSQIDAIKPKMEIEKTSLAIEKAEFDSLSKKIQELQAELAKL